LVIRSAVNVNRGIRYAAVCPPLEVILKSPSRRALAIIGELIRIGARNAAIARDLTTAQLYCESKMSEAAAGVIDLENLETETLDEDGEWMCAITTEALDQQQLVAVTVTVGQNPDVFTRPVSFSMIHH
jgi:hypothetical protein